MKRFHFIVLILILFAVFAFGEKNGTSYEECFFSEQSQQSVYPNAIKRCPYKNERMGCYWRIRKNGRVQRGCVSDFSDAEKESCRPDNPDCGICFSDQCNFVDYKKPCAVCDSAFDKNCISLDKEVSVKYCNDYRDECYTFINRRTQQIQRGCLKEANNTIINQCNGNENGENANSDFDCIITDALWEQLFSNTCFKCDSDIDSNCIDRPIFTENLICSTGYRPPYRPFKGCYYYKNGNKVKRGCVRDLQNDLPTEEYEHCKNGSEKCHICKSNNCNQKNVIQQKCFKCDGNNDQNCVSGESIETIICSNYSMSCYSEFDIDGYTHRGCTDIEIQPTCYTDYCNNVITPPQRLRCYQCNGGPDCNQLLPSIKPKPCQVKHFRVKELCYTHVADDGNIHRGCLLDKGEMSRECLVKYDKCTTCSDSACNNFNRTSTDGE